jgi:hypothetical protein
LIGIGGLLGGFKTLGAVAKGVGWVIGGVFTAIVSPILTVVGSVAFLVDGVASFLGFGDDNSKKITDTTTKKDERSFFSKLFSSSSDNKNIMQKPINTVITSDINKNFISNKDTAITSGIIEKQNYITPPSFNEVTNKYDSQSSSFIGSHGLKKVSYTFNFGDINITATDGKIIQM